MSGLGWELIGWVQRTPPALGLAAAGPMLALALIAVLALALVLFGIHGRRAQIFGRSVWRGPGRRKSIAITFDDGPSPATLKLASYLEGAEVRATFFLCGSNVLRHPGVARALQDAGHELGNHTHNHRRLCPRLGWKLNVLRPREVWREIEQAQSVIARDAGSAPRIFRAPYGMRWFGVGKAQQQMGLLGVLWTAIGHDWEWDADEVAEHMMKAVEPGAIFCLHDGRDTRADPDVANTLAAVRTIVPRIQALGYRFETVSEILRPDE